MIVALELAAPPVDGKYSFNPDPSRVIQGVIGGIGFPGAGSIIRHSADDVRGLTTGAGIWVVGAMGLAGGSGYLALAALIGGAVLFVQIVVKIAGRLIRRVYGEAASGLAETSNRRRIPAVQVEFAGRWVHFLRKPKTARPMPAMSNTPPSTGDNARLCVFSLSTLRGPTFATVSVSVQFIVR